MLVVCVPFWHLLRNASFAYFKEIDVMCAQLNALCKFIEDRGVQPELGHPTAYNATEGGCHSSFVDDSMCQVCVCM